MVVKQALGGVEDLPLLDAVGGKRGDHAFEVPQRRLVRADILCGDDPVELDAEAPVAALEALAIDIGEDAELEVLLEVAERLGRIREGRPVGYGRAEARVLLRRARDAPLLRDAASARRRAASSRPCRGLGLLRRLVAGEGLEDRVVGARAAGPAASGRSPARMPLSQSMSVP